MRILIVDDERPARDKLRRMLEQEGISAIDEARDGVDALQHIAAFQPDACFLDIQMPEVSGLELAASLPAPAPLIVFVTAFDQYAIRAFDANAIDYLLKPFDLARLQRALLRLRERLQARPADGAALPAFDTGHPVRQLLVTERGVTRVVRVDQVGWIETADNYVVLHCPGEHPLMRQTLAGLLDKLGAGFVRCHRRAAVQVSWIDSVVALDKGDCELVLRGGARVPCSRQYRAGVMERLQGANKSNW
ncbi:MAG: DNA-binding response regulator [Massilia sp.]|nr:DNA-binding response regulator [Massilia sp.]